MDLKAARDVLLSCFTAAVSAVDPEAAVAQALDPIAAPGRVVVFALGKAAPAMTRGVARALDVDRLDGLAISNHRDTVPHGIELRLGSHPVPAQSSIDAGVALLDLAATLTADDVAIVLISGGGSALAEVPAHGLGLADIVAMNELLLRSGADIVQANTVRRRLSLLKGGGLAAAIAPARLVTLLVSDVIGDIPAVIASGPTVDAQDSPDAAYEAVVELGLQDSLPANVMTVLRSVPRRQPPPPSQSLKVVASGAVAAHAAAGAAERSGLPAKVIDTRIAGDATAAAGEVLLRSLAGVSVFAGETTVNVVGDGVGGRNQEAALVAATLIEGQPDVFLLAAGTDGIDGTTRAAGAIVDGSTVRRSQTAGYGISDVLERNDSGTLFAAIGDQIVTGATGTNVGDIWLILRAD